MSRCAVVTRPAVPFRAGGRMRGGGSTVVPIARDDFPKNVVPPARFERTAPGLGILCSIHLSYGGAVCSRLLSSPVGSVLLSL